MRKTERKIFLKSLTQLPPPRGYTTQEKVSGQKLQQHLKGRGEGVVVVAELEGAGGGGRGGHYRWLSATGAAGL